MSEMPETEKELFHEGLVLLSTIIYEIRDWIKVRKESIRLLEDIANYLDDTKRKVNTAKKIGASAGILGGAFLGAGALASVLTLGAAAPFVMGVGIAGTAASALVSGGAEVVMLIESKEQQDKVKEVLKKDNSKQEVLFKKEEELRKLITELSQEQNISEEEAFNRLFDMFLNIAGSKAEKRRVVNRLRNRLGEVLKKVEVVTLPRLTRIAGAANGLVALAVRNAARGAIILTPILVAINAYEYATTDKDVKRGSKSEYGQQLRKLVEILEEECASYKRLVDDFELAREIKSSTE